MSILERLAAGALIEEPVALVVAHPDDETLWVGAALPRFDNLLLIHLTDGAPRDMADARMLGFETREAYAAARAAELDRALSLLGARPKRLAYGHVDKEASDDLEGLAARLACDLAGVAAVLTHPYEGGHPDHDAAAFAVQAAARRMNPAPERIEFACYHKRDGERVFGSFWPDPENPELCRPLPTAERARVSAAVEAHRTQAHVFGDWRPSAERWRRAPDYDFMAPPPPGEALYDGFGWAIDSAKWRARAREALALC